MSATEIYRTYKFNYLNNNFILASHNGFVRMEWTKFSNLIIGTWIQFRRAAYVQNRRYTQLLSTGSFPHRRSSDIFPWKRAYILSGWCYNIISSGKGKYAWASYVNRTRFNGVFFCYFFYYSVRKYYTVKGSCRTYC